MTEEQFNARVISESAKYPFYEGTSAENVHNLLFATLGYNFICAEQMGHGLEDVATQIVLCEKMNKGILTEHQFNRLVLRYAAGVREWQGLSLDQLLVIYSDNICYDYATCLAEKHTEEDVLTQLTLGCCVAMEDIPSDQDEFEDAQEMGPYGGAFSSTEDYYSYRGVHALC